MTKKHKFTEKIKTSQKTVQDTVIFMTAYNVHKFKHRFLHFWQKNATKELLKRFHIEGVLFDKLYVSHEEKCRYTSEYNSLNQISSVTFDENIINIKNKNPRFVDEMTRMLSFSHSIHSLLDPEQIDVSMYFNLESFLVVFETKVFQVDPVAFIINGSLVINFELVDFESTVPLTHDAIYGRTNNYGIHPISKIKYFNESEFIDDNRRISDVIFQNVYDFLMKIGKNRWEIDNYSYVHNIFVMSNKIDNIPNYFQKVLGAQIENFEITNVSATDAFDYYSTEYLGVVTNITNDDISHILFDCITLESFKIYLLLKMIIDYKVNHKLDKIIDSQIYVESLFYPTQVPIITLNVIDNIKKTESFLRYKEAIDFKVKALKIERERKRTSNGRLMNLLLYVLSLMGSIQTLQVLDEQIGLPFKTALIVVSSIFVTSGILWIIREIKKQ